MKSPIFLSRILLFFVLLSFTFYSCTGEDFSKIKAYKNLATETKSSNENPTTTDSNVSEDLYNPFSISIYMTKGSSESQGMDICKGKAFVLLDGGTCLVYDFTNKIQQALDTFNLGSKRIGNHCNCANFGIETKSGASFPLLYVSNGKVGDIEEYTCNVESITETNGKYSSEKVQTITLDQSGFTTKGLQTIWGCPNWVVDKERKFLWAFSAIKRTLASITGDFSNNKYLALKFRIPTLNESKNITFTADDVLDEVIFDFDAYATQGGYMKDGKIYYAFGFSNNTESPQKIRIFDTDTRKIIGRIDLQQYITEEPEDLVVTNGKLYLNTNSKRIYEISFPSDPLCIHQVKR